MGGLAHRRVIHFEIAADRADHNLSRVQTNSYLDGNSLGPSYALSVTFYQLLHTERGIASTYRMIFMRQRCPEQSHDTIAHDLVDCSFIPMHRFHHVLKHRIEDLSRLLRITVCKQLHRTFHVNEQHRDLLSLAFTR